MHNCLVKICGIRTQSEAKEIAKMNADFIGILVNVRNTNISISVRRAMTIVRTAKIKSIILTPEKNSKKLVKIIHKIKPWGVQLMRPSPQLALEIKKHTKSKVIPMVFVNDSDPFDEVKKYASSDYILLDSKNGTLLGGTGIKHDWNISKKIISKTKIPIILAGGLNSKNVKNAIKKTNPFAVDAESSLRNQKSYRDLSKVEEFIKAVKKLKIS